MRIDVKAGYLLAISPLIALVLGFATQTFAGFATGGGKKPENDCLVELQVQEVGSSTLASPVKCDDCNPNCDQDSLKTANKMCTFQVALCVNQMNVPGCTGTALKTAIGRVKGHKLPTPSDLTGAPACGDSMPVIVGVKGKKKLRPGKATVVLKGVSNGKGKQKRTDADRVVLECDPQTAQTCPTTTTTTTTLPCNCCGAGDKLRFTTGVGTGKCGTVQDASGAKLLDLACGGLYFGGKGVAVPLPASVPDMGTAYTKVTTCNPTTGDVTLGATTAADTGSIQTCTSGPGHCQLGTCDSVNGVCTSPPGVCTDGICTGGQKGRSCATDEDCDIGCTADRDCGICDAGNVGAHCRSDQACGCVFGAPLPVPNATTPAASTCVINSVAGDATGTGTCAGAASVSVPLSSEVYLHSGGDFLPKRCSASTTGGKAGFQCLTGVNCPGGTCQSDPAIQPCPICNPTTLKCNGGPNEGAPCTPGTSDLGKCSTTSSRFCRVGMPADCPAGETCVSSNAYPTSMDCPPDPAADIGPLPISFSLTTGTVSKTAFQTGTGISKVRVYCPACRNPSTTVFENPPHPCTSDADCTNGSFTSCEQLTSGAFGFGCERCALAAHIEETGSPAMCLADGAPHPSTLVSVFCIPPSYNSVVDSNGDLPGPGAVALVGEAQLLSAISTVTTSTITTTTVASTTTTTTTSTTTTSVQQGTTTTTTTTSTTTTMGGPCCGFANGGPKQLRFENTVGSGNCGSLTVGTGTVDLVCGGLYFGGAGETVPLPAAVPDKGVSLVKIGSCNDTTKIMTLAPAAKTDAGASIRTCSNPEGTCTPGAAGSCSGGTCSGTGTCTASTCTVGKIGLSCGTDADCDFDCHDDTDCGVCTAGNVGAQCSKGNSHACSCLFGPPLPIPNQTLPSASTCVINTVGNTQSTTVSGSGNCVNGTSSVSVPLNSEVFLTGDIMLRRCNGGPTPGGNCLNNSNCSPGTCVNDPTIQPCPICNPTTNTCNGGPNEGAPCTPGTSNLGKCSTTTTKTCRVGASPSDCPGTETCNALGFYPTSHDCLPPHTGGDIGGLPIGFSLTSGSATKSAFSTGTGNGKANVFCPACRNPATADFENPPRFCMADSDCTNGSFTSCEQRNNGAFHDATATNITETGVAAGDTTDGAKHSATLVSVFCIPPAYDPTVDANGDLPGPGAVSLPGMAQLLP